MPVQALGMSTSRTPYPLPDRSDFTLTTAAQIGAALPHLLGFHPEQSIVCLWLKRRQLVVTQRADTPDDDPAASGVRFTDYVRALFAPVWALDVDEVIVVYVAREPDVPDGLVRGVAEHCPVSVRVHLHMRGARIRECTPDHDHGASWGWIGTKERQQAAAYLTAPHAPRPAQTRQAVAEELSYQRRDGEVDTDDHSRHRIPLDDLMAALMCSPPRVSGDVLRDSVRSVAARDAVLWSAARMTMDDRRALLGCLVDALAQTPPGRAATIAAATGVVAWLCGDGVRANAAIDRCMIEDPDNYMGTLIAGIARHGVPPSELESLLREMPEETLNSGECHVDGVRPRRYSSN